MIDRTAKIPLAETLRESTPGGKAAQKAIDKKALKEACAQFEALIVHQLLKGMRKTVDETSLFHGGQGEKIFQDMHDQALADEIGQTGSLGLAELLYQQILDLDPSVQSPGQTVRTGLAVEAYLSQAPREGSAESDALLIRPVEVGYVSSSFGMREHPILGGQRMHYGIDLAAPEGTSIKAAADGEVVFAGQKSGYGYVVEVDHGNGLVTVYGHNQENKVKVGQRVEKGQVVALVGQSGLSTGPHLHFEVRREGQPINPTALLQPEGVKEAQAGNSKDDKV